MESRRPLLCLIFFSTLLLFFSGNFPLYGQETAGLFNCTPIGWSAKGIFAYIIEEEIQSEIDEPVGGIPVIYYVVQNMISDRILEKSIPTSDISSFYALLPKKIAEIKKKYVIKELESAEEKSREIYLLHQNEYIIDITTGQGILFEAEQSDTDEPFSITALLRPDNKKKVLSRINADELEIAGYVESPFEKRIALCVVVYDSATIRYDDTSYGKIQTNLIFIGCHVENFN